MPVSLDYSVVAQKQTAFALQIQGSATAVRGVVMSLVGFKVAAQHLWLHVLFHAIPVMEAAQPPVFSVTDTQLLLLRTQVW